jgi:DNA-binding NtrC family response regulator
VDIESRILIVDDEKDLLESAEAVLSKFYRHVKLASSVESAKAILLQKEMDIVVADLNFEGQEEDGIVLLDFIIDRVPDVEVVVLSGDRETARVVDAMRRNLVDFIPKSGDYGNALKLAIARGLERKRQRLQKNSEISFLTNSPKMLPVLRMAQRVAASQGQFPVLILGETGTGKEVMAKYLAKLLRKKMVAANMASIPRETAESELFGHVRGAFTGAVIDKAGLIEQAHGGIFFLDELGECSQSLQAKLLRVIQEKEIQQVGNVRTKKIETRFFGATNRDLDAMLAAGTFREDLLHRLNTVILRMPPLRVRPEDIVLYTNKFLTEVIGDQTFTITSCGMDTLLAHPWPGNIRELKNIVERMVILSDKRTFDGDLVASALNDSTNSGAKPLTGLSRDGSNRSVILGALEKEQGNRTKTAARLGVHVVTLQRWMKKLGITEVFSPQPGRPSRFENAKSDSHNGV